MYIKFVIKSDQAALLFASLLTDSKYLYPEVALNILNDVVS